MMLETLALEAELQKESSSLVQAGVGQKHTSVRSADLAESAHGKVKDLPGHKYAEEQESNEKGGGTNVATDAKRCGVLQSSLRCFWL